MESLTEAIERLTSVARERVRGDPVPAGIDEVHVPVGLFLARGDRAGEGKVLAEQVVASYGYWHLDAGQDFDMVFLGWGYDGIPTFQPTAFLDCVRELAQLANWRYGGETEILLLDFVVPVRAGAGRFAFDEVIWLPVEEMIRDKRLPHLDKLMNDLVVLTKGLKPQDAEGATWQLSDRIARSKQGLWLDGVKAALPLGLGKVYDGLRPYAVCDLTRKDR